MVSKHREEVLNVVLALLLHRRGTVVAPEQVLRYDLEQSRAMPDILVYYQGLRTVIEGRSVVTQAARNALLKKTRNRVQQGIAHLGIALIYPTFLKEVPFGQLEQQLTHAPLQFAVISEVEDVQLALQLERIPEPEDLTMPAIWAKGDLDSLGDLLRRTYERLVREDVVQHAAQSIKAGIVEFSDIILGSLGSVERSAVVLGIKATSTKVSDTTLQKDE